MMNEGKKPMWQGLMTYLLIGLVVYAGVYYLFLRKPVDQAMMKEDKMMKEESMMKEEDKMMASPSADSVMFKTNMEMGSYLVDDKGMTLYIYDKDTEDGSNCYESCAVNWPPYVVSGEMKKMDNLGEIKRTDGKMQYTWKGMPLYYYAKDAKVGDITGDGVGGAWHLVK